MNSVVARLISRAHRPAEVGAASAVAAAGPTVPAAATPAGSSIDQPRSAAQGQPGYDAPPARSEPQAVNPSAQPPGGRAAASARGPMTSDVPASPVHDPISDSPAARRDVMRLSTDVANPREVEPSDRPPGLAVQPSGQPLSGSVPEGTVFERTASDPVSANLDRAAEPATDDGDPRGEAPVERAAVPTPEVAAQPPVPDAEPRAQVAPPAPVRAESLPPVVIDTIRVEVAAPAAAPPDPFGGLRHHAGGITHWGRA